MLRKKTSKLLIKVMVFFLLFSSQSISVANAQEQPLEIPGVCFCYPNGVKILPDYPTLEDMQKLEEPKCSANTRAGCDRAVNNSKGRYICDFTKVTFVVEDDEEYTKTHEEITKKCEARMKEYKAKWDRTILLLKEGRAFDSGEAVSSKFIPECLLTKELSQSCRDVSIFIKAAINLVVYLFTIAGALALIFFIYGGFTLVLSQGNSEKVQKGIGIITSAVIGLIIIFSAYLLVGYIGDVIGIDQTYKLL